MATFTLRTLLRLLPFFILQAAPASAQASGTGTTTRYWDCCKASCSWPGKAALAAGSNPVGSCDANDSLLANYNTASGCDSGSAYMCGDQTPWAVSDTLSYGYAAVNIAGGTEASWCCACYELTFTSGSVAGKQMIVQATNTGGDLGDNHFDLAMPGGGFGLFDGCIPEFGTPTTGWGTQYGGISGRSQCDSFPLPLRAGCYWRFDWFEAADNPAVSFKQVTCPAALTAKTGCVRADDAIVEKPTGPSVVATWSSGGGGAAAATSSTKPSAAATKASSSSSSSSSSSVVLVKPSSLTTVASSSSSTKPGSTKVVIATAITTTSTTAIMSPSKSTSSISPPPSASSSVSGGTVPKWGQCGGINYSGPTTCVSGTTCVVGNPWYSQCL